MFEIRLHGRGGQGVVSAAEILSVAAFIEGKESQAFPSFGSERMGAPVMAFCRIDATPIRAREPVSSPDAIILQDPTLLGNADLFAGLSPQGYVLINSDRDAAALGIAKLAAKLPAGHVRTVPAGEIARKHVGKPLPNAALLGAFAVLTGELKLESIAAAIREKFPGKTGEQNVLAATEAAEALGGAAAGAAAEALASVTGS